MAQSFGSPGMWRRQRTVESGSRLTGIGTVMESEYRLDSWEIVTFQDRMSAGVWSGKMVYTGVEGAEEIPGSISLKEDVSGSQAGEPCS